MTKILTPTNNVFIATAKGKSAHFIVKYKKGTGTENYVTIRQLYTDARDTSRLFYRYYPDFSAVSTHKLEPVFLSLVDIGGAEKFRDLIAQSDGSFVRDTDTKTCLVSIPITPNPLFNVGIEVEFQGYISGAYGEVTVEDFYDKCDRP